MSIRPTRSDKRKHHIIIPNLTMIFKKHLLESYVDRARTLTTDFSGKKKPTAQYRSNSQRLSVLRRAVILMCNLWMYHNDHNV